MSKIVYAIGDATRPTIDADKIITHVCNDVPGGSWGSGFVLAISARWSEPKTAYHAWARGEPYDGAIVSGDYKLGECQLVPVEDDIWVANLIGQHNTWWENGVPPIRVFALRTALLHVAKFAKEHGCQVVAPRLGAGLAGGKWCDIERILQETLCDNNIPVTVYDLPTK